MAGFLLASDTINGKEGRAFMSVDGQQVELFNLKNFNSDADFTEEDFNVVGSRLTQKKTSGIALVATFTVYYGTPFWIDLVGVYLKTGKVQFFDIQIINDDKASTVGRQTVVIYNCKVSSIKGILKLDSDANVLSQDITASYTSLEVLEGFVKPKNLGNN